MGRLTAAFLNRRTRDGRTITHRRLAALQHPSVREAAAGHARGSGRDVRLARYEEADVLELFEP